jgi:anthranilate synthase component 2
MKLVIDNYDSFTYNLVHYLEDLNCEVTVYRNDEFEIDEIAHLIKYYFLRSWNSRRRLAKRSHKKNTTKKYFGVCLGQQAIGESMEERFLISTKCITGFHW